MIYANAHSVVCVLEGPLTDVGELGVLGALHAAGSYWRLCGHDPPKRSSLFSKANPRAECCLRHIWRTFRPFLANEPCE